MNSVVFVPYAYNPDHRTMDSQATLTLNTGARIPVIGFGTWQAPPHEVGKAVEFALRCGYRHIDCAAVYRNEKEVGIGIAQSGVKRKDLFITSKLWNTYHDPKDVEAGLDKTLKDLGTHYLDLHLIHWPVYVPGFSFIFYNVRLISPSLTVVSGTSQLVTNTSL